MRQFWPMIACGASVVAFALGHLVAGVGNDSAQLASQAAGATGADNQPAAATENTAEPRYTRQPPQPAPDGAASETAPVSAAGVDLRRALEAIPVEPVPTGNREILGLVTDEKGVPISGVTVRAVIRPPVGVNTSLRGFDYQNRPLWQGIEEDVRALVRMRRYHHGEQGAVVTGPDGQFRLTGLAEEFYWPSATLAGWRFEVFSANQDVLAGQRVRIVGTREFKLEIKAVNEAGEPVVDFRATVTDRRLRNLPATVTDGVGIAQVPPGPVLIVVASASPPLSAEPFLVEVQADTSVTIAVHGRPAIWGKLSFTGFQPQGLLRVALVDSDAGVALNKRLRAALTNGQVRDITNPWLYSLEPPREGRWLVAVADAESLLASREVDYTGKPIQLDFELTVPASKDCIVVRMSGGNPGPAHELRIKMTYGKDGRESAQPGLIVIDEDQVQILAVDTKQVDGPVKLYIDHGRRGRATVDLLHSGAQTVDITFQPTCTLVLDLGTWRKPTNVAMRVELLTEDGKVVTTSSWQADRILTNIPPGTYSMQVSTGAGAQKVCIHTSTVTLTQEVTTVKVALPELYDLMLVPGANFAQLGKLSYKSGGTEFSIRLHMYREEPLELTGLPAGDYVLTWYAKNNSDLRSTMIRIPASQSITLGD